MSRVVFVDFETFGVPGKPENIWQFAYGFVDTSQPEFWKKIDFFSGLIDWSRLSMDCISPGSREFTLTHTPDAFDWVTGKKPAPCKVYTRKEFAQETIAWFRKHELCPDQAFPDWNLIGRYPKFDFECFPAAVRESIGLEESKLQDVAVPFAGLRFPTHKGRLPTLDQIKSVVSPGTPAVHHDALKDIQDEIRIMLRVWKAVANEFS
jgi:hypothetical protein